MRISIGIAKRMRLQYLYNTIGIWWLINFWEENYISLLEFVRVAECWLWLANKIFQVWRMQNYCHISKIAQSNKINRGTMTLYLLWSKLYYVFVLWFVALDKRGPETASPFLPPRQKYKSETFQVWDFAKCIVSLLLIILLFLSNFGKYGRVDSSEKILNINQ